MIEAIFWLLLLFLASRVVAALVKRFARREPPAAPVPMETWISGEPPRPELATDVEVLRFTLDLVLDRIATLAQPVQRRLRSWKPHLTPAQVDAYTFVCQEVRDHGIPLVEELADGGGPEGRDARTAWRETMLARYPWLLEKHLASMWAQGMHGLSK